MALTVAQHKKNTHTHIIFMSIRYSRANANVRQHIVDVARGNRLIIIVT